jgi:hypothetical protein
VVEKILTSEKSPADIPVCLPGARACPPEDCGGVPGYERPLEARRDPTHEEPRLPPTPIRSAQDDWSAGHDNGPESWADLWAETGGGGREDLSLMRHMPLTETAQPMGNMTTAREVLDFPCRRPPALNQRVQGSSP